MEPAILAFRFILASVFILAGLAKLPHRREFARLIRRYEVLPPKLVSPVAALLPPIELSGGVCLALGLLMQPVAGLLGIVLCAFALVVGVNLLRGNEVDCGCFNISGPAKISWLLVGRNLALAAMAAVIVLQPPGALSADAALFGFATRGVSSGDALGVLIAATGSTAVVAIASESSRVWRARRIVSRGAA